MSTCARPRTRAPFLYLAHSCSWRNLSCIHFLYSCSRSFSWDMRTHTKRHTNEVPTHSSCASCKCRRIFAYANSLLTALCVATWTAPVRKSSRFLPKHLPCTARSKNSRTKSVSPRTTTFLGSKRKKTSRVLLPKECCMWSKVFILHGRSQRNFLSNVVSCAFGHTHT